ncbi:MAG: DCC1-like thiol-disulfide oxidoreductase family protein, partial [Bacteroidia bacterium]|nr:DCC1-like thiol-disulfide oxidoreductase family protein [Bacteroidia bacterium]
KFDAVIIILEQLGWKKTVFFLYLIPKFIRNWLYRLVAKNRYRLFGKQENCRLPTPELKTRFLTESFDI